MAEYGMNYNYPQDGGTGKVWNNESDQYVRNAPAYNIDGYYDPQQSVVKQELYNPSFLDQQPGQNLYNNPASFVPQMIKSEPETLDVCQSNYCSQSQPRYESHSNANEFLEYNQYTGYGSYSIQPQNQLMNNLHEWSSFQPPQPLACPSEPFNPFENNQQNIHQQQEQHFQGEFSNPNCVQNQYKMPQMFQNFQLPNETTSFDRNNYLPAVSSDSQVCDCNDWDKVSPGKFVVDQIPTIFNFSPDDYSLPDITREVLRIEREQCFKLKRIKFGRPITHIYSPLVYAFLTHYDFITKYCKTQKDVLFLGMNPGPFGMAQNGVPFGAVEVVNGWLQVTGNVFKPWREHPKRIISGADCSRSEISGTRFWKLFMEICKTPDNFFRHCFVHNFCPMAFMNETGRNLTPPDLEKTNRHELHEACDSSLLELIQVLNVKIIIGVGRYAETRAKNVLKKAKLDSLIRVECLSHPSPLNREAHKGWEELAYKQLDGMGVVPYLKSHEAPVVSPPQLTAYSDQPVMSYDGNFYLPSQG